MNLHELEQQLQSIPSIDDVVMVPVPDELYGHRLIAFIETSIDDSSRLAQAANQLLQPKVYPIDFRLVKALPRYENGKVNRQQIQQEV